MKHAIAILVCALFVTAPALAQSPPVPKSKKESLIVYDTKLKEEQSRQANIEKEMSALSADLESTRDKLLDIAGSIQENESNLQAIESRMDQMEADEKALKTKLEKDRLSISRLVLALERIARVPPEALIVKPGAPLQTAQSAMLLADIIPMINKKTQSLNADLTKLADISAKLSADKAEALARKETLTKEQEELAGLIKDRESIFIKTQKDYEQNKAQIRKISAQAENLKDLVKKLEENNRRMAEENRKAATAKKQKPPASDDSDLPSMASGDSHLPVSGVIRTAYNQPDSFGAPSKGLRIEGRGQGLVVSPLAGKVRFTGDFKNYGNMVIIEHKGGYHSLIAGLEKIDTLVGQTVGAGEPIGKLGKASRGANPVLYYELRQNGQPVNPATKLASLG